MKLRHFSLSLMSLLLLSLKVFGAFDLVVIDVSPPVGSASGGTEVAISGSGFTTVNAVYFGGVPATSFTVNSDSSVTAVCPAHSPKVVSVKLTNADGTSLVSKNTYYTYQGNWQAYVTNSGGDNGGGTTVSVFDTGNPSAGSVAITVGDEPNAICITPDGSQAYVANYGNGSGSTVSVIDTATNTVIGSALGVGEGPNSIAITPGGKQIYVANSSVNSVSVINRANDVIGTILVGNGPDAVAVSPDGKKVFVANFNDSTVSVIDTATNTVIGSPVSVAGGPLAIALTPDGDEAYLPNFFGTTISVIDTANQTALSIPQILGPVAAAITPNGKKAYVANYGHQITIEDTVFVIDPADPTGGNTPITVGQGPTLLAISHDGSKAYVVNYNNGDPNAGTVSVIDTATDTVVGSPVTVGIGPNAIAITPDGAQVYVANFGGDVIPGTTVSIIDGLTNAVSSVAVGDAPTMIAITPDQAPLAKFVTVVAPAGQTSTFDASGSVTPTGTIKLYSWDFGDGHALNTSSASASHVYQNAGNYTVNLTVTNSAGTSTTQIFSYYGYNNNNFGSYNVPMTHNGGSTAKESQIILVAPVSPKNFHARQAENVFYTPTAYVNILSWDAPASGGILSYRIYRNAALTDLVSEIQATKPLRYEDHNRIQGNTYTYYIVSVAAHGISAAVNATVNP